MSTSRNEHNVLLIEDDTLDQMQFCRMLVKLTDKKPEIAESIANAKSLLEAQDFDIIICDNSLPDGSGEELLDYLKKYSSVKILLSGSTEFLVDKSTSWDMIIEKPIDESQLADILDIKQKTLVEKVTFSMDNILAIAGEDDSVKQQLTSILLTELEPVEDTLAKLSATENWKDIGFYVHKLKSKYRLVNATELLTESDYIEKIAKLENPISDNIYLAINKLTKKNKQLLKAVKQRIQYL